MGCRRFAVQMRASSFFILLCCILFVQGWVASPPSRPPPVRYYALGDSYATGLGAGEALETIEDERCHRTNSSYPELFKAEMNLKGTFKNFACPNVDMIDVALQVREIPANADLISLSWGLDKIRIPNVVYNCVEYFHDVGCNSEIKKATALVESYFPGYFFGDMVNVVKRIRARAPNALIVVLGYPRFFGYPPMACDPTHRGRTGKKFEMMRDNMQKLILLINHRLQVALDNVDKPFRIKNKELIVAKLPDEAFSNHRYCDADPWFNPFQGRAHDGYNTQYDDGFFHPNVEGQREYQNLLAEAWEEAWPKVSQLSDELKR